jgi:hypothetical protein
MPNRWTVLLVAASCSLLSACSKEGSPTRPPSVVDSIAGSPIAAVGVFESGWDRRSLPLLSAILAEDFSFAGVVCDSPEASVTPLDREAFLAASERLFGRGTASLPPARSIALELDRDLASLPDSRPGKSPSWHAESSTRVALDIDTASGRYAIRGAVRFFLVRGDSAACARLGQGAAADSGRWYVERIEEEAPGAAGSPAAEAASQAQPARCTAWGDLLRWYLEE